MKLTIICCEVQAAFFISCIKLAKTNDAICFFFFTWGDLSTRGCSWGCTYLWTAVSIFAMQEGVHKCMFNKVHLTYTGHYNRISLSVEDDFKLIEFIQFNPINSWPRSGNTIDNEAHGIERSSRYTSSPGAAAGNGCISGSRRHTSTGATRIKERSKQSCTDNRLYPILLRGGNRSDRTCISSAVGLDVHWL